MAVVEQRSASRGTVHLLCGLPGCGKTTWAKRLAADTGATMLSHDAEMIARHGVNPPLADFARFAAEVSEALWRRAEAELGAGRDVILDWGFWTRAEREAARARAAGIGGRSVLHVVECPDAVAKQRTLARSEIADGAALLINAEAWDVFRSRFEPPGDDEDVDRVPAGG